MSCTSTISNATLPENSSYVAINLQDILYGIQLVLYIETIRIFLARRGEHRKSDVFYAVFSTVMLLLITIWVATQAIFGQQMWLLDRNYPGGPTAYARTHTYSVYMDFGATAVIILQQMTDALMMYRCRIVWDSPRAIVAPSVLWSANFALGIMVVWACAQPGSSFFGGMEAELGLAYYTSSVFLNITLTCMICYRLVRHARKMRKYVGEEHASPYFSIVALLVESVLPYTLSGVAFLVAYGVQSEVEVTFSYVYTLMMCVSPQMLILRVVEGKVWKENSMNAPTSVIMFSSERADSVSSTGHSGGNGGVIHLGGLPSVCCPENNKV